MGECKFQSLPQLYGQMDSAYTKHQIVFSAFQSVFYDTTHMQHICKAWHMLYGFLAQNMEQIYVRHPPQ